jgi:hypothetical protein
MSLFCKRMRQFCALISVPKNYFLIAVLILALTFSFFSIHLKIPRRVHEFHVPELRSLLCPIFCKYLNDKTGKATSAGNTKIFSRMKINFRTGGILFSYGRKNIFCGEEIRSVSFAAPEYPLRLCSKLAPNRYFLNVALRASPLNTRAKCWGEMVTGSRMNSGML